MHSLLSDLCQRSILPFDDLDVGLRHLAPEIPVDDVSAVTVQDAAQGVKRPTNVEVGNVDVLVLVRRERLLEPRALLRRLALHFDSNPAWLSTRYTLEGLTATMLASSIINVSRR